MKWHAILTTAAMLLPASSTWAATPNATHFLSSRTSDAESAATPPDRWSAEENVDWQAEIPGIGWSSPIAWGDRVFITTCVNQGEGLEPRKGLYIQDLDATKYDVEPTPHAWKVLCLDLASGKVLWEQTAHEGLPPKTHHLKNTLASETPVTDGQRLYVYFGNIGVFCYDLDGTPLWNRPIEPAETRLGWGTGASPVVHEGRVYIVNDNEESSYLLALDAESGEEVWRVERDEKSNWVTPFVWEHDQRTELVTAGSGAIRSYDLEGNELWQLGPMSYLAIPTPQAYGGLLYITSGHILDKNRPVYAIKPGAAGDITLQDDATSSDYVAWRLKQSGSYHPTPVIYEGRVYVLLDRGMMACYDARTGDEIYGRQRIPEGRAFTSSPWAYDGKIFCLNEDGITYVIKAGPEFEILYTNPLAEDDMCMATPAVVGDKLLIRSSERLYCIGK